jgi:Ulp1 family protease
MWADRTKIMSYKFYDNITFKPDKSYSWRNDMEGHYKDPWYFKRIIFPCWVGRMHWILIVWTFRPETRILGTLKWSRPNTVEIYDSIHDNSNEIWADISEFMGRKYVSKSGKWSRRWEKAVPRAIVDGPSPTQRDGFNCGFYVIQIAKDVLFHKNPRENKYHVPRNYSDSWGKSVYRKKIMTKRRKWESKIREYTIHNS